MSPAFGGHGTAVLFARMARGASAFHCSACNLALVLLQGTSDGWVGGRTDEDNSVSIILEFQTQASQRSIICRLLHSHPSPSRTLLHCCF